MLAALVLPESVAESVLPESVLAESSLAGLVLVLAGVIAAAARVAKTRAEMTVNCILFFGCRNND
jgi:hypothetical protein